ncbi:MAG: TIGR00300 family protein, partial [Planctomycetota bacterium]
LIVCGEHGVRVRPFERQQAHGAFQFAAAEASVERPRSRITRSCALQMRAARQAGRKLLLVAGPAVVPSGAADHVVELIEGGWVDVLFAGNGLASYDIEVALYGTCLGVCVNRPHSSDSGYTHHLRAINAIRAAGGIRPAVECGRLTSGIMHACVRRDVRWVLAGSIRDDGPLPDVVTDVLEAQGQMRAAAEGVGFALMLASRLHATATANLLPAATPLVCVDMATAVLARIRERSPFQTLGVATDVEPFLRALIGELKALD